jgi:hypothetical protein
MVRASSRGGVVWVLVPFLAYLLVLNRLWTDAPVWDDYEAILLLVLRDKKDLDQWLTALFVLHNEHRIVVTRLVTLALAYATHNIDFRVLMLLGNLSLLGTMLLMRAEFRDDVAAPIVGAGAILMFQWSYYEAALMASAAMPHLGVVFFALGCIFFALRPGRPSAVLAVLLGRAAAGSQANGLFALPIAAAGCLWQGRGRRGLALGLLAALVWGLYFHGYAKPTSHPSLLASLSNPLHAAHLFFVILGGVLPGTRGSAILGLVLFLLAGGLLAKGLYRKHPVAALWMAFLLATAAAATAARVGFGVMNASRYAIVSTTFMVLVTLAFASMAARPGRVAQAAVLAGAITIAAFVSWRAWPEVSEYVVRPKTLREMIPATPDVEVEPYGGAFFPDKAYAGLLLTMARDRGFYRPAPQTVHGFKVAQAQPGLRPERFEGHIDVVRQDGARLVVEGWAHVDALAPGRVLYVESTPAFVRTGPIAVTGRVDVARLRRDAAAGFSGFRMALEFDSAADAAWAAQNLCVVATAPGRPAARLGRTGVACVPAGKSSR